MPPCAQLPSGAVCSPARVAPPSPAGARPACTHARGVAPPAARCEPPGLSCTPACPHCPPVSACTHALLATSRRPSQRHAAARAPRGPCWMLTLFWPSPSMTALMSFCSVLADARVCPVTSSITCGASGSAQPAPARGALPPGRCFAAAASPDLHPMRPSNSRDGRPARRCARSSGTRPGAGGPPCRQAARAAGKWARGHGRPSAIAAPAAALTTGQGPPCGAGAGASRPCGHGATRPWPRPG